MVFGDPMPLAFYVKQAGFYEGYAGASTWNPIDFSLQFLATVIPFIILVLLFAGAGSAPVLMAFFIPVLLTFISLFSSIQIMG